MSARPWQSSLPDDRYIPEDAAKHVVVEYEPPPVVDCLAAVQPDAPKAHRRAPNNIAAEFDLRFGDVDSAFSGAAHVLSERFRQTRDGSHPIECRSNAADYVTGTDRRTLWRSTQTPHAAMRLIAELLGRDEGSVRVIAPDVGGGFGPKLVFYQEDIVCVVAAMLLKHQIKWIEDRREHFVATTQEHDQYWDVSIAVDADGRVRGIRDHILHDHEAYTVRGVNVAYKAAQTLIMAYDIGACDLNVKLIATNLVPATPVRGAGQPQGTFVMERLLDRVAREFGLDRAEVRRRNLIAPEQIPYAKLYKTRGGVPVIIDSGDYPRCQAAALTEAGWTEFSKCQQAARISGRYLGMGLANFVELTGCGLYEPVMVKVNGSGRIHVLSSATSMGQSTKTMLRKSLPSNSAATYRTSSALAIPPTRSPGSGGFGSRQTVTASSSAHTAAIKVREKVLAVAGHLLECSPADLEIEGTDACLKGASGLKVTLAQVAKASIGTAGFYLPGGLAPGLEATEQVILNNMTYSNGAAVATVEVDIETGATKVLDIVFGHDCGRAINL